MQMSKNNMSAIQLMTHYQHLCSQMMQVYYDLRSHANRADLVKIENQIFKAKCLFDLWRKVAIERGELKK